MSSPAPARQALPRIALYHEITGAIEARDPDEDLVRAGQKRKLDRSFETDTKPLYNGQRQQDMHHTDAPEETLGQAPASGTQYNHAPGASWRRPAVPRGQFDYSMRWSACDGAIRGRNATLYY